MGERGLTILIPCLNEERTVEQAVHQALTVLKEIGGAGEVLVIDNGSHDRSAELASRAGARVVAAEKRGYGHALRRGFEAARFEFIAMVDADLSYPMDKIPQMFAEAAKGHDLVLGNRLRGNIEPKAMPTLNRYLGTPVLSILIRLLHTIPTYDCNSGLRILRKSDVASMNLRSGGMEVASEILVRAAQLKLKYTEIVIPFYRDQRGHKSHLNRWNDGIRHLKLICQRKFDGRETRGRDENPQQNPVHQRVKADIL